jgi:hypothetical protein
MSDITPINANDIVRDSRAVINTNFENLNTDKVETLGDLGITSTAENIDEAVDNRPTDGEKAALAGGGAFGTPSGSNKFVTEAFLGVSSVQTIYNLSGSPHTWTKATGLKRVRVQAWGGGGGGSSGVSTNGGGGGGGGYFEAWFEASELGATETVTVGAGGASVTGNSAGNAGANSTFGSLLTAFGGAGGAVNGNTSNGGAGGGVQTGDIVLRGAGGVTAVGGVGVLYGGGGGGGANTNTGLAGGTALYGGAGGGASGYTTSGAGGTSRYGGNGGTGSTSSNGTAGSVPAGGGGGSHTGASGAGGNGRVIVTEYY